MIAETINELYEVNVMKETEDFYEKESNATYGWLKKDGKYTGPRKFDFPDYVQERIDWVTSFINISPFVPSVTVFGAVRLLLDFNHEDELKKYFEEGLGEYKPFTEEYKRYFNEFPTNDIRQARLLEAVAFC